MAGLILRTVLLLNDPHDPAIHDIAARWVAAARAEAGVTAFDGYLDMGTGRFVFLEQYRDSDAFMVHRTLVDPQLRAKLYGIAKFEALEVYGDPSAEVREALAGASPATYRPTAG